MNIFKANTKRWIQKEKEKEQQATGHEPKGRIKNKAEENKTQNKAKNVALKHNVGYVSVKKG